MGDKDFPASGCHLLYQQYTLFDHLIILETWVMIIFFDVLHKCLEGRQANILNTRMLS